MTDGQRRKLGLTKKEGGSPLVDGGPCIICGSSFQVPKNLMKRKFLCGKSECSYIHNANNQREKRRLEQKVNHKVVSVEFVGNRDVYNMEVEGTHNFAANGIYVHNCDAIRYALYTALKGGSGFRVRFLG